jgi:hypothetical protein
MSSLKVSSPKSNRSVNSRSSVSKSKSKGKGKSLSQKTVENLESVLYVEMYTSKVGTLEELWHFHNSDELDYIPSIHIVDVVDDKGNQYVFRENESGTAIFGSKILSSGIPKLIKLNKKRMGID